MKLTSKLENSGHWYQSDGKSAHGATLREARKQNLYPSVTTILSLIASPGLDKWKRTEAILAALTLPRNEGESLDDFAQRVAIDMEQTGTKAAAIGTTIHDWVEKYCAGQYLTPPVGYETVCYQVQEWIDQNVDLKNSIAEDSIVNTDFGYAGRIDLMGRLKDGRLFIADWKTQNIKTGKNFVFYPKWCQQLAAYAEGKQETVLINIAISSNKEIQQIKEKIWTEKEIADGWATFRHCLAIWQIEKQYRPNGLEQ